MTKRNFREYNKWSLTKESDFILKRTSNQKTYRVNQNFRREVQKV